MNIAWDADKYTSNFSFVPAYGRGAAELIASPKGSRVLDLGCGNGALTGELRDRGFRVTGLDSSKELLSVAEKYYPELEFILGDATDFSLKEPVDAVFSNAVFHSGTKRIEVSAVRTGDGRAVDFCVRDSGCGIAPEDAEKIFKRFYRCDASRTLPGNGLGLAMVQAIANAHRARIELESSPGKGSCFSVIFPPEPEEINS